MSTFKAKGYKEYFFCILFGVYAAAVLWITLLSRIGTGYRGFLFPFESYIEVLKGKGQALLENIENVLLFMPFGIALRAIEKWNWKRAALTGFCVSLGIELIQVLFALGIFEFDDLLHNTLGTVIGYWVAGKTKLKISVKCVHVITVVLVMLVSSSIPFGVQAIHHQHMVELAALHDREDGTKNLLVLDGKDGYAWDTDVYVSYQKDGSIRIQGTSDKTSWWPIAGLTLEPGTYSFSGLSGVEKKTVGLELETENRRFAPDVGPEDEVRFDLTQPTELKIYVFVYDGCDCDVTATPVIYKEE